MQTIQKTKIWSAALVAAAFLVPCFAVVEREDPGYLGVSIESMDRKEKQETGASYGVRVTGVEKGSPAQKAGMKEKDIIQSFGGGKIRRPADLIRRVRATPPDSTVTIGLVRDKAAVQAKATIGKVPRADREHRVIVSGIGGGNRPRLGVQIHALNDDLSGYFGVPADEGALILEVDEGGPAMKAGLKPGDVIVRIGKEKVYEPGDVTDILKEFKAGDKADVAVVRKGRESVFSVTLEKSSPRDLMNGFSPRDPVDIRILKRGDEKLMKIEEGPMIQEEILRENLEKAREELDTQREILEIRREGMEESAGVIIDGFDWESDAIPVLIEESAKI
jgi:S1-C subfamily serine protease